MTMATTTAIVRKIAPTTVAIKPPMSLYSQCSAWLQIKIHQAYTYR